MACVTSHCHTCTSHATFHYKRSTDASSRALDLRVRLSGLPVVPVCGLCLTCVGHDASSASLGWSLPPLNIIIV